MEERYEIIYFSSKNATVGVCGFCATLHTYSTYRWKINDVYFRRLLMVRRWSGEKTTRKNTRIDVTLRLGVICSRRTWYVNYFSFFVLFYYIFKIEKIKNTQVELKQALGVCCVIVLCKYS